MPGNYDGRSAQITTATALNVTAASNTNPITITVSGALPASFFTAGYNGVPAGPLVDITGVQGNTAANGQFVATPTGASTFTIPVAGNGAYTTGGSVQPLNLQSLYTLPSDGDSDNSASIAQWGQATGDRTQFLAGATGALKRYNANSVFSVYHDAGTSPPSVWGLNSGTANAYTSMSGSVLWTISDIRVSDVIDFYIDSSAFITNSGAGVFTAAIAIGVSFEPYGGSPGSTTLSGAKFLTSPGSSVGLYYPIHLSTTVIVPSNPFGDGSTTGKIIFNLYAQMQGVSAGALQVVGDYLISYYQYRPTAMPQ